MAYLPDTEDDTAIQEAADPKRNKGGFGVGFVTGAAAALICVFVFFAGWYIAQMGYFTSEEAEEAEQVGAEVLTDSETLYKLNEIQSIIEAYYYDEVDGAELSDALFSGAADGLGDPYAEYYSVEKLQSVIDETRGEYYGIGVTLSENLLTGEILVMEVYEDSPAAKAGLQVGDSILSVENLIVPEANLSDLVVFIKKTEDPFVMRVYRDVTDEELELTMQCSNILVEHVQYEMKDDQIGYIRISEFSEAAVAQFQTALEELKKANVEKLLVDLRNNPGGLLDSVCDILDMILPKGLIVYTEDRDGNRSEYESTGKTIIDRPIAVLVNGYSASASEIFSGAVQDYGLGPVMGTQTYGKGVVQRTFSLSDGSAFKMTVEKYFTPNGQDIDGNGITPDVLIEEKPDTQAEDQAETDEVLAQALEILNAEY